MTDRAGNPIIVGGSCYFRARRDGYQWRKGTVRQIACRHLQTEARVDDGDPAIEDPRDNGARLLAWVTADCIRTAGAIGAIPRTGGRAMTPDLEALARRAVACPRWRWMPGMRWVTADDAGRCDDYSPEHMARPADALPDFSDAGTRGCLLDLVREAWNEPYAFVEHCEVMRQNAFFCRVTRRSSAYETEAEALVAALEAAP